MLNWFSDKKNIHTGEKVYLVERNRISKQSSFDGVATVYYDIYANETHHKIGKCDLRFKNDGFMYYYGNIGYNIMTSERGHHYAYYACKILFLIAKEEFDMHELIITCDPGNDASYKTLKKLGGQLKEIAQIPYDHELYVNGDRFKCIFYFKI